MTHSRGCALDALPSRDSQKCPLGGSIVLAENCWPGMVLWESYPRILLGFPSLLGEVTGDVSIRGALTQGQPFPLRCPMSPPGQPGAVVVPLWAAGFSCLAPPLTCPRAPSCPSSRGQRVCDLPSAGREPQHGPLGPPARLLCQGEWRRGCRQPPVCR